MMDLDVEENSKFKNVPLFLNIYDIRYSFFQDSFISWQDVMWVYAVIPEMIMAILVCQKQFVSGGYICRVERFQNNLPKS